MKLLFCESCWDVFKLDEDERSCKCGEVTGKYVDSVNAVTNGKGVSIAIGNGSLIQAIAKMRLLKLTCEEDDTILLHRGHFIDGSPIGHAWVRPNEGEGNPHTTVEKDVQKAVGACEGVYDKCPFEDCRCREESKASLG